MKGIKLLLTFFAFGFTFFTSCSSEDETRAALKFNDEMVDLYNVAVYESKEVIGEIRDLIVYKQDGIMGPEDSLEFVNSKFQAIKVIDSIINVLGDQSEFDPETPIIPAMQEALKGDKKLVNEIFSEMGSLIMTAESKDDIPRARIMDLAIMIVEEEVESSRTVGKAQAALAEKYGFEMGKDYEQVYKEGQEKLAELKQQRDEILEAADSEELIEEEEE